MKLLNNDTPFSHFQILHVLHPRNIAQNITNITQFYTELKLLGK